uniref:Putative secreted protein n=1 Tax=Anopheles darlingi TaxID=43151 RepID=A0A2M4DRA9_ANODA
MLLLLLLRWLGNCVIPVFDGRSLVWSLVAASRGATLECISWNSSFTVWEARKRLVLVDQQLAAISSVSPYVIHSR